jgi:hypothetical protein
VKAAKISLDAFPQALHLAAQRARCQLPLARQAPSRLDLSRAVSSRVVGEEKLSRLSGERIQTVLEVTGPRLGLGRRRDGRDRPIAVERHETPVAASGFVPDQTSDPVSKSVDVDHGHSKLEHSRQAVDRLVGLVLRVGGGPNGEVPNEGSPQLLVPLTGADGVGIEVDEELMESSRHLVFLPDPTSLAQEESFSPLPVQAQIAEPTASLLEIPQEHVVVHAGGRQDATVRAEYGAADDVLSDGQDGQLDPRLHVHQQHPIWGQDRR